MSYFVLNKISYYAKHTNLVLQPNNNINKRTMFECLCKYYYTILPLCTCI